MNEKLARDGGTPVRTAPFPTWPVWDGADEKALLEVLRSGVWGRNAGTHVVAFEEEFAAFQGTKYCIAVVNGTCALELGLRVLDVEYGDEVIVPSYTFVATPAAPLFLGAIPVFADIDPDTFELDPASVEAAITPRTKAIIPVHIAGQPPDMDGILAVAAKAQPARAGGCGAGPRRCLARSRGGRRRRPRQLQLPVQQESQCR